MFLVLLLKHSSAQEQDFQTWSSASLKKSFSKKTSLTLEEQLRLQENSTQLRQLFTEAGVKHNFTKSLSISANYRFIIKPNEIDHRIFTDISYDLKKKKLTVTPRIRLQHQFNPGYDENYIRPKLELDYKLNRHLEPFIAEELFYHALYYKGSEFDESRFSVGAGYDFDKHNSVKLFFLLQQEFNVNAPQQNHVLGLGYEYSW